MGGCEAAGCAQHPGRHASLFTSTASISPLSIKLTTARISQVAEPCNARAAWPRRAATAAAAAAAATPLAA